MKVHARLGVLWGVMGLAGLASSGCDRKPKGDPNDTEMVWLSDYPGEMTVLVGGQPLFHKNEPLRMSQIRERARQLGLDIPEPLGGLQRDDLPDGTTTWK